MRRFLPICVQLSLLLLLTCPMESSSAASSQKQRPTTRFISRFLGDEPVLGPSQALRSIDWRYKKIITKPHDIFLLRNSYHYTEVSLMGIVLTIKCTNFSNRTLEEHCPGMHHVIKFMAIRIIFFTMGLLAAAIGTCDLAFAKKFQEQRTTVLRQIPLSRRDTVMGGFDYLRHDTQVRASTCSSMILYDMKDTGLREELLRQREAEPLPIELPRG